MKKFYRQVGLIQAVALILRFLVTTPKTHILVKCCFCCFCCFFGYHDVVFHKVQNLSFLWNKKSCKYLYQIKSYPCLKFGGGTVTHLWTGVSCGHVCVHKNCFELRVITPITFPCTYGSKHVSDILFRDLQCIKNFFSEPKVTDSEIQNYNFL